jgi:hypothetical protein
VLEEFQRQQLAPDGRRDPGAGQPTRVLHRGVPRAAIAVIYSKSSKLRVLREEGFERENARVNTRGLLDEFGCGGAQPAGFGVALHRRMRTDDCAAPAYLLDSRPTAKRGGRFEKDAISRFESQTPSQLISRQFRSFARFGEIGMLHFDRDFPIVLAVVGQVDGGHPARAELAVEAIAICRQTAPGVFW